jgi:hypothetical protein
MNEELSYEKLSPEEMEARRILGRLYGPCADIINATRNGRKYSEELWEKVFDNAIMKEKFERGGVFGECGHPVDREEVDIEKIALCMPQPPKKDNNGTLVAVFDILDTPCGKILKTLCDYGYKIGISSRGSGETYTDNDGNESVDPDSYDCECFDAVLIPAVKAATLSLMKESLDNKSLKKALTESLNNANEADRKLMQETLSNLHISYNDINESVEKTEEVDENAIESNKEAVNNGDELVNQLQESLKREKVLEEQIATLQEQLSVSNAKETNLKERLVRFQKSISTLKESVEKSKALEAKVKTLTEEINKKDAQLHRRETLLNRRSEINENLKKDQTSLVEKNNQLTEGLNQANKKITSLETQVEKLTEGLTRKDAEHTRVVNTLNESIQELKKDSAIKSAEYKAKLGKSNQLVEKYKKTAQSAVNKYIESQARAIGVSSNEIKNKLTENYSFQDIDRVVESLKSYSLNMSKLPINVSKNKATNTKMTIKESYEPIFGEFRCDDDVDEQLLNLTK